MVTGTHYYCFISRYFGEELCCVVVLLINIRYVQFLILVLVYANSIYDISLEEHVFCFFR